MYYVIFVVCCVSVSLCIGLVCVCTLCHSVDVLCQCVVLCDFKVFLCLIKVMCSNVCGGAGQIEGRDVGGTGCWPHLSAHVECYTQPANTLAKNSGF